MEESGAPHPRLVSPPAPHKTPVGPKRGAFHNAESATAKVIRRAVHLGGAIRTDPVETDPVRHLPRFVCLGAAEGGGDKVARERSWPLPVENQKASLGGRKTLSGVGAKKPTGKAGEDG